MFTKTIVAKAIMVTKFKRDSLTLRKISGTMEWKVANKPMTVKVTGDTGNYTYRVPVGFVTDLASVPKFLFGIFPNSGIYTEASVLHDYMYSVQSFDKDSNITRKDADSIYVHMCKDLGVGKIRSTLMYVALRSFGWTKFRK